MSYEEGKFFTPLDKYCGSEIVSQNLYSIYLIQFAVCGFDHRSSRQGLVAASHEHGNEPSSYIKGGEFID
jgi:hypothetical protein